MPNEKQVESFKMKQGLVWENYCGKCMLDRPFWNGATKRMCHRWHIKGGCFDDCAFAESHVPADEVPSEKVKEFEAYMKKAHSS